MKKISNIFNFAAIAFAGTLAGAMIAGLVGGQYSIAAGKSDIYKELDLFGDVLERVRKDYVEKPSDTKLIRSAINGMLTSLDPHSAYLSPESLRDMQDQTNGFFGGLGIEVRMENGLVKVISPIDDTPAAKAGILPGDLISHLDGESIEGLTLKQAVNKMRGPVNTQIVITVLRKGVKDPFDVKITRDIIRINKIVSRIENDDIAYIRIPSFHEQTTSELHAAIKDVYKKVDESKVKGFVIDLRNNPGGLLDQAIDVSDTFLEQGAIVITRGRNLSETQRANAKSGDLTHKKKIVVLMNGGSASASEIVAGALQDHKRATIVGTRSFGKGSVQTIIPLGPNGAIRLTTALYYTPSNTSIQAKGITPNLIVQQKLPDELKDKITKTRGEASLKGHLQVNKKEDEQHGSIAFVPKDKKDDTQLQFAIKYLKGLVSSEELAAYAPKKKKVSPQTAN